MVSEIFVSVVQNCQQLYERINPSFPEAPLLPFIYCLAIGLNVFETLYVEVDISLDDFLEHHFSSEGWNS